MSRSMSITTKLTLLFFLSSTLLLASVGGLAYQSGNEALEDAVISDLTAILTEKQAALEEWIEHSRDDIAAIAAAPELRRSVSALTSIDDEVSQTIAHDQILTWLQPWTMNPRFLTLMVIEPSTGQVIAATDPSEESTFRENRPYFLQGRQAPTVDGPYHSQRQGTAMTAAAPILSEDGELLGVLAARMNLDEIEEIINRRSDRHQSDDAYLIDKTQLVVTMPRLIVSEESVQGGIRTTQARRCVAGESGVLLADDYRGIPVISVYQWLPERNLCLIVELDQSEAYAPTRTFGFQLLLIAVPTILIAAAIAFGLARTITRPILALQQSAIRFGQGDLSVRLPEDSKDELGLLAREFNAMATALMKKEAELRRRAEELKSINRELQQTLAALSESEDRFRRLAQENADLAEVKTKLLHEVNHRVKNNLTAIIGLLYSERNRARERDIPEHETTMNDLIARVQGLATVHQLLSASDWAPLRLSTLVEQIADTTLRALSHDQETTIDITCSSPIYVESEQAHNIAMIINELTTNTLKYVKNKTTVHIQVDIDVGADQTRLEFRDHGPGYPDDVLRMEKFNVGLKLVNHIVTKNLEGELLLTNDSGAVTIIQLDTGILEES